jgi:hypothetical protein
MSRSFHFKINKPEKATIIVNSYSENAKDVNVGQFSWMGLEGTYTLHDRFFDLTIVNKPKVLKWSVIESNLEKFLKKIHIMD